MRGGSGVPVREAAHALDSAASPAAEDSAAAVVSAAAAAVVSFAVLLPPHAAKDSVMAEASVRDIAFLMLLLIIITLPFLFCVRS